MRSRLATLILVIYVNVEWVLNRIIIVEGLLADGDIKFVPVLAQVILYIAFLVPSTLSTHICIVWTRR